MLIIFLLAGVFDHVALFIEFFQTSEEQIVDQGNIHFITFVFFVMSLQIAWLYQTLTFLYLSDLGMAGENYEYRDDITREFLETNMDESEITPYGY